VERKRIELFDAVVAGNSRYPIAIPIVLSE
jgi:hypothetical protein